MLDDEWDWDRSELADLDVTGDPQLDVFGYNAPKQRGGTGSTANDAEVVARNNARREQAAARRQAERDERRRRNALPPEPPVQPVVRQGWSPPAPPPQPVTQPAGPQPGQHGAYFERRMVRRWWAPWTKRTTWQQISAWQHGQPPADVEVVTVADVTQLPGQVHTIGRVGETGAVEY